MDRARAFYEITKLLESYVHQPSGVADDVGIDEHVVDAEAFVQFFEAFWNVAWLSDIRNSFFASWASWAAGIVANITLEPVDWADQNGEVLRVERFVLDDSASETLLVTRSTSRRDCLDVLWSSGQRRNIVVRSGEQKPRSP